MGLRPRLILFANLSAFSIVSTDRQEKAEEA